jgi:dTDP-4-dehydrorhamnose reductase
VIGASGQIGGWLMRHLAERGHDVVGTYATVAQPGLERLNAGDPEAANWVRQRGADVVFYPAGFTWVDGCERDPAKARAANCLEPLTLARATLASGGRFVTFSTDYVFDGARGPYGEGDAVGPLNEYGRAKLEAERLLTEELGDRVLIVRTCWVYGPEWQGKNFAYQVVRALREGKILRVPSDQWANPSYGPDVAEATIRLVERGESGLVHVAGPEHVDRVGFGRGVARALGFDESLVVGVPTAELGQGAPRPLRGGLRSEKLEGLLPGMMRGLAAGMADFVEQVRRGRARDPIGC